MFGAVCPFDRLQHVIIHHQVETWIKRLVPANIRASLFMYFHTIEKTFVMAEWTGHGVFRDLVNFGPTLNITQANTEQLRKILNSHAGRDNEYGARLRDAEYNRNRRLQNANDYLVDRREYVNKTGVSIAI